MTLNALIILMIVILVVSVISAMVIFFLFPIVRINGDSMSPTLKNGEVYSSRRLFRKDKYVIGEIYVFRPPYDKNRAVIKRLIKVSGNKLYFVGDNLGCSFDSRDYGYVDSTCLIAILKEKIR